MPSSALRRPHWPPANSVKGASLITYKEIYSALQASAHNAGIRVFNTYIPLTVRITESPRFKTPIIVQLPNHEGATAYQTVVEEIINGKQ
jgi:cellulose biosynthesis protein BcsQ